VLYRSRSRAGVVESVDTVYFTMGRRYGFMMNDHFQHGIMHDRYASGTPGFDIPIVSEKRMKIHGVSY